MITQEQFEAFGSLIELKHRVKVAETEIGFAYGLTGNLETLKKLQQAYNLLDEIHKEVGEEIWQLKREALYS